ncbi:MAG: LamG domain-containing protein, partial [Patescibacteria group bacterium]
NYNAHQFTPVLQANTWYHVVAIRSGGNIVGYLNGVQVFNTSQGLWPASFSNVNIGRGFSTSAERWFSGKVDDVRIYNYALTADQVKQVMQEASAVRF